MLVCTVRGLVVGISPIRMIVGCLCSKRQGEGFILMLSGVL